ncbi:MAG: hypothetical protein QOH88_1749 [Verrucomicrobiota bacterium]|jgi:hypothetical protein
MRAMKKQNDEELWDAVDRMYHPELFRVAPPSAPSDALWEQTDRLHEDLHTRDARRIAAGAIPLGIQRGNSP